MSSLAQIAHAIGHGELSRRLPVSSRMDEIDILSAEINVALARLQSSVAALKQVTIDVAHDLKTPNRPHIPRTGRRAQCSHG
ncbi:HAMP domain-containing protein [Agrobacterium fabrum]|uniref:HAMP domain-containing protein n=1 Tax=Agrobacterium fabrum TaxID=1176649 RepID=UPI003BA330D6